MLDEEERFVEKDEIRDQTMLALEQDDGESTASLEAALSSVVCAKEKDTTGKKASEFFTPQDSE